MTREPSPPAASPVEGPRFVSVIVPALNAARTIPDQLAALAAQTYAGAWEVVVSDNGSDDGTPRVARAWAAAIPNLRIVDRVGPRGETAAISRNAGAAAARGDFLAFCDADDVVDPGWLEALVQAAARSDLVRGRLIRDASGGAGAIPGDAVPEPVNGFLPFASSSNMGIKASVFDRVGGWNAAFRFSEDKELSWRVQLAGYRFAVAPEATIAKRDRPSLRGTWRQSFRWSADEPQLFRTFRRSGMPRSSVAEAAWNWMKVVLGLPYLIAGRRRRTTWVRLTAAQCGRLWGSVRHRVLYL